MRYDPRVRPLGQNFLSSMLQWGQPIILKSVTPISISLGGAASATQTVAVNPANCLLLYNGNANAEADNPATSFTYLTLTNATTVTAVRQTGASGVTVTGTLIEFGTGVLRSVQRGVKTFGAATTATQAITAVTLTKSLLNMPGFASPNVTYSATDDLCNGVFTSATLLTFTRGGATGAISVSWEVAQFI